MKILRSIVAAGIAILALAPAEPAPAQQAPFDLFHIVAHGRRQDTSFYDFTGDGTPDVVISSIDYDVDPPLRWLALHVGGKNPRFPEKPTQIWAVPLQACAVMMANVVPEGGVDICLIAPDGVYFHAFDKATGQMAETPKKLIHTRTFFTSPSPRSLPGWMIQQDLNNDMMDDLVIPVPEGYKVYFQTAPGIFGTVVRLESQAAIVPRRFAVDWQRSMSRGVPPTSALFNLFEELPRLATLDMNGDKLQDLATIRGDVLSTYIQEPGMSFAKVERSKLLTLTEESKLDTVNVSDVQFCDINKDGNVDIVVTRIQGELGLLKSIQTKIYTHLGGGRGTFAPPDGSITIDGISLNPQLIDMNGDGLLDCLTSRLRTDVVAQGISAKVFGDVTISYEVFQFDGIRNHYSDSPVYTRDIRIRVDDIQKRGAASKPLFYVPGDLSGDGKPDAVLFNPKTNAIEVYRGRDIWVNAKQKVIGFEKDIAAIYEDPERDPEKSHAPKWLGFMDMDGDKRTDIVLNFSSVLTFLVSRF